METNAKIKQADIANLRLIRYPDPRLREVSTPVDEIDDDVRRLVEKMFEILFAAPGVGLAAVQAGVPVRLFVACPTGDPKDRRVYVNPRIVSEDGSQEEDEGCLSVPGITTRIKRRNVVTIRAVGLDGKEFEETGEGLLARLFQHETDHLNGRLILDRMGSLARLANRRLIKELEDKFAEGTA